eukprot:933628_1
MPLPNRRTHVTQDGQHKIIYIKHHSHKTNSPHKRSRSLLSRATFLLALEFLLVWTVIAVIYAGRLQRDSSPVVPAGRLQRDSSPVVPAGRLQRDSSPVVPIGPLGRVYSPVEENHIRPKIPENVELGAGLAESLRILERPDHRDRIEHLIGPTLPGWKFEFSGGECKHTADRNYQADPIRILKPRHVSEDILSKCNVPCRGVSNPEEAEIGKGQMNDACTRNMHFDMENRDFRRNDRNVFDGTPKLHSTIPIQYMDWDYGHFSEQVTDKKYMAAAFISNCGLKRRNNVVSDLQKYGVEVHSFGRCLHNRDEGGKRRKVELLREYKFALAFENSETDDYVTEKFFEALMAGAIPVYLGAPNIKWFWPSSHSVIRVLDYPTTAALADHLLYLDGNRTAFREYLQWKVDGYDDHFKA